MKPKILTHLRNFYKCTPRKLRIYAMKGTMHWRKLRNLKKKKHLSYEILKENHTKFKYYTRINVEVFDCLFDYLQVEKDIETVKKKTKKGRQIIILQGPIDNDIDQIKTEHSI